MITIEEATRLVGLVRETFKMMEKEIGTLNEVKPSKSSLEGQVGIYLVFRKSDSSNKKELLILGYPIAERTSEDSIRELACNAYIRLRESGQVPFSKILVELHIPSPLISMADTKVVEYAKLIVIGKHGVMVERNFHTGLILPYIAIEKGWDWIDMLSECCMAAGLSPDAWFDRGTKVYIFEDEVFRELEPQGEVARITNFNRSHSGP